MIGRDGTELYCSIRVILAKYFDNAAEFPELISLSKEMIAGKEGRAVYAYDRPDSNEGMINKTAYYLPVRIKNSFWSIAVVFSKEEITSSLASYRNKLILIFSLVFAGGLFLAFFGVKALVILKETEARQRAEDNLFESEKRFEQLIKGLPQLIWTSTPEGLCDFLSNQWLEYTGIPESEQLGDRWLEQIHPEDQAQLMIEWNKSVAEGKDFKCEYRIRRHDGVYHWFDTRALPLKDVNGKIIKWLGSNTDVQKERDMREALKENEERYRLISTVASDYMFYSALQNDGTLKHVWVAGAFETITGYTFKEYVDIGGWAAALHPDDREQDIKDMNTLKSNKPAISEIRTITKNGNVVWVRVYASPVWDDKNNSLKGITGAVQDITERKTTEQELRKLYVAIEQSPAAIVITDTSGKIEYANTMFTKISGYSQDEVKGDYLMILKPDKNFKELNTNVWNTISNGKEWHGEYFNEKKDGSFYWESTLISPIKDSKGIITNYLAVQEDVTEKKITLNELVLAKEKAEEAIKVKNVFLGNMSHELRTPLIGILGYSEMLTAELKQLDLLEMAMGIRRSGNRLLNTLNLILDLTRIESDKFELNLKTTNLANEIEFVYHIFYGAALEKKISFTMQFIDRELYAKIDEHMFKIVLENIINNAIKFTNTGSITIIAGIEKGETVYIEIKDTGIGIAKEHQDIIFEEFRQVSQGISRDYQGTGLGLAITKRYVEILGGTISVTSELGLGSSFILRFPLVQSNEEELHDK
jgi:PAS domain S-box-containing protein